MSDLRRWIARLTQRTESLHKEQLDNSWSVILPHFIPVCLLLKVNYLANNVDDTAMVWLIAAFIWRYFRFFVHLYALWQRRQACHSGPRTKRRLVPDVTIVIPTIDSKSAEFAEFTECFTTCLAKCPAKIIIVTDTKSLAVKLQNHVKVIQGVDNDVVRVLHTGVANKREQMIAAIDHIKTDHTAFVDDHIFLPNGFFDVVMPLFNDPQVGLVGTRKVVRRKTPDTGSILGNYWQLYWNFLGAVYLERHNYELLATNFMDGGVFVVSGRAMVIRTEILRDKSFQKAFLTQTILGLFGPLIVGDDNFITRWVLRKGYKIKITADTVIETTLGEFPRFISQCLRWRRTTIQNAERMKLPTEIILKIAHFLGLEDVAALRQCNRELAVILWGQLAKFNIKNRYSSLIGHILLSNLDPAEVLHMLQDLKRFGADWGKTFSVSPCVLRPPSIPFYTPGAAT
ncbi:Type 2 glycosyltransferase [Cladobotryum mycophilum]|uniref:Type 2 glycosyltransferase n=1 Tax=Cladobotryum mycophilum TaxID=491253 RepID=A0ABR0S897_9HYPO